MAGRPSWNPWAPNPSRTMSLHARHAPYRVRSSEPAGSGTTVLGATLSINEDAPIGWVATGRVATADPDEHPG